MRPSNAGSAARRFGNAARLRKNGMREGWCSSAIAWIRSINLSTVSIFGAAQLVSGTTERSTANVMCFSLRLAPEAPAEQPGTVPLDNIGTYGVLANRSLAGARF